jgi:hypothetical protein
MRGVTATGSWRKTAAQVSLAVALVLTANGCGSSARSSDSAATLTKATGTGVTPAAAMPARLHIVFPRAGASTGATVTVRVTVTGATAGAKPLRYLLDDKLARLGATRLTFHELAPGRHRLTVSLATNHGIRAVRLFNVRVPVPTPPVTSTPPAQTSTPPAQTSTPPAHTEMTRETPPPTETQPKTTHTTSAPEPPSRAPEGAIPQGNGGDRDSDNNGGPSDGDGTV